MGDFIKGSKLKQILSNGRSNGQSLEDVSFEVEKGEFIVILGPAARQKHPPQHNRGMDT